MSNDEESSPGDESPGRDVPLGLRSFPSWSAPLIGAAAGAIIALRAFRREDAGEQAVLYALVGGVCGAVAGGVLWLLGATRHKWPVLLLIIALVVVAAVVYVNT